MSKYLLFKRVALFFAFPVLAGLTYKNYRYVIEHEDDPPPEFIKHEYRRLKTSVKAKHFPWGDGRYSLFHNKRNNALPDGYEEVDE